MKIAVCDDESVFVKRIYKYLWQQPDCTVECFLSPVALQEKYAAGERYDVVFLDILMSPVNGMDLARKIRGYDQRAIIIFLTVCPDYSLEGYEVNAFRYLLKPVTEKGVSLVMREVRKEMEASGIWLLKTPECEFLLHTLELRYLEADNKETILHYMDDTITLRRSLNELAEQLSARAFFRIHRKYLVNLARVREFDKTNLTLDCGQKLPVSRRKSREFRLALNRYIEGDLRT